MRKKYSSRALGDATKHPLYPTWLGIRQRCFNPNTKRFNRYGGRGITMCARWLDDFWAFVGDVGQRPDGTTLDRIDNDGNYEPGNVRWATDEEQINNRCISGLRLVTYNGETKSVSQWEKALGFRRNVVSMRLNHGWSDVEALTTPPRSATGKNLHPNGWKTSQVAAQ